LILNSVTLNDVSWWFVLQIVDCWTCWQTVSWRINGGIAILSKRIFNSSNSTLKHLRWFFIFHCAIIVVIVKSVSLLQLLLID